MPMTRVRPDHHIALCACLLAATLTLSAVVFARSAEGQVNVRARTAEASHLGWPTITGMLLQNSNNKNRPLDGRPGYDPFDGTDPSYSCDGENTGGLYHDCGYPGISDGPRFTTLSQLETECRQEAAHSKAIPPESAPSETESSEGTSPEGPSRPKKSSLEAPRSSFVFPMALLSSTAALPSGLPAACAAKYEQTDLVPANIGHNELLGGDGNDTIHAGPAGDVIWGDSHAEGNDTAQVDRLYGGAGDDWIYASHGTNYIWTGAGVDHLLLVYGHGVVYCNGPGRKILVMRKLSTNRHYRLVGCTDKRIVPYAA
jgi:RTX calcium-binding nonapeptide repeat (4 copies)